MFDVCEVFVNLISNFERFEILDDFEICELNALRKMCDEAIEFNNAENDYDDECESVGDLIDAIDFRISQRA